MKKYVIGIDEVGRGALAGPVLVAAVCLPAGTRIRNDDLGKLRDSKKLSASKRMEWFKYLRRHPALFYKVSRVYPRGIERLNITGAANRAASRVFSRLLEERGLKAGNCRIFLDGGLYLRDRSESVRNKTRRSANGFRKNSQKDISQFFASTITRGDEKIAVIKLASIVAKVSRDEYMKKLSKKYPRYGFEIHKGYGTKKHLQTLRKHGPSTTHRLTFLRKRM